MFSSARYSASFDDTGVDSFDGCSSDIHYAVAQFLGNNCCWHFLWASKFVGFWALAHS